MGIFARKRKIYLVDEFSLRPPLIASSPPSSIRFFCKRTETRSLLGEFFVNFFYWEILSNVFFRKSIQEPFKFIIIEEHK